MYRMEVSAAYEIGHDLGAVSCDKKVEYRRAYHIKKA
jgi:hypothetical protein